jgi:hypothetical protein
LVEVLEAEPAEQQRVRVVVEAQLVGRLDCAEHLLGDDPLVADASQRLTFDELAAQPVADRFSTGTNGAPLTAAPQLHQLADAHPGHRRRGDQAGGPGDAGHGVGLGSAQR